MSRAATLNRQAIQRFNSYWEDLMEEFPEAKAEAVRTMGQAAQRELNAQIRKADLEEDAKGTVISWQNLRFGSRGGYAAVTPRGGETMRTSRGGFLGKLGFTKPKKWKGTKVTTKMVTKWLEQGHGVRKADTRKDYAWSENRKKRNRRSAGYNPSTGMVFVKGRMFYSWTKMRALDLALDAANNALERFAEKKGV